jgi:glycosyltransferase involved in cell wall biosynthesis
VRILLTVHQFLPTYFAGTEIAARDTGLELLRRGHEVHVLTVDPSPDHAKPELAATDYFHRGLRVHALRIPAGVRTRHIGPAPVRLEYADQAVGEHVGRWARELAPDVVHMFHLARLTGSAVDALRDLGVPLVFTATDFWSVCVRSILMRPNGELCAGPDGLSSNCLECRRADRWFGVEPPSRQGRRRALYRRIASDALADTDAGGPRGETVRAVIDRREFLRARLDRVDAILAPTALMREMLISNGLAEDLIRIHPYSIDTSRFRAVGETRTGGGPLRFGYIGMLRQPKGIHVLIRAFRQLPDRDATLEIIGDPSAEPDYFRQLYTLASGDDRIRFAGAIPNERIPDRLARIDVQVVPSIWWENAPLTIYSAQAAGVPVVASDLRGMSEVVSHGENGLLFEPGNVADLTTQLRALSADPGLVDRLAANARRPVTSSEGVDELLALYDEILMRGPGSRGPAVQDRRSASRRRTRGPAGAKVPPMPALRTRTSEPAPGPADGGGPHGQHRAHSSMRGARRRAAARRRRREVPSVFFVVGRAKSGTTWLMRTLDAHPEITCRGEGRFFGHDYLLPGPETATIPARPLAGALAADGALRSWLERSVWARDRDPDEQLAELTRIAIDHFLTQTVRETGKPIVGDKTPFLNAETVREIARIHPTAKVVQMIRDGRDVAISAKHHVWNRSADAGGVHRLDAADLKTREDFRRDSAGFGADGRSIFEGEWLAGTAREWATMIRRSRTSAAELLGERYLEVRYEEMLAEPFDSTKRVLAFLDADTEPSVIHACVDQASFERASRGRRLGDERPTEFLRNGLAGQWKDVFTDADRATFEREAGDVLIELGYEADPSWAVRR